MENQVDGNVAQKRSEKLISLANELKLRYMQNMIGQVSSVLIESQKDGYVQGYTPNYVMVKCVGEKDLIGKELKVMMSKTDGQIMTGNIIY